jgi:nucleoside-diphosphate-sugar epimerase
LRVLVTGASGFIGSRALRQLTREGYEVHCVGRRIPDRVDADVNWHSADLLQYAELRRVVANVSPSHLLHLAWVATPGTYVTSSLNYNWLSASIQLFRQFQIHGGHRAVISGSCAEYDWRYGTCIEEKTPLVSNTPYSACKNALRLAVASMHPVGVAWARVFFAYGAGEPSAKLVSSTVRGFQTGRIPKVINGNARRDFVHVEDIALGLTKLLTSDYCGAVNVCTGTATSISEVVAQVASCFDESAPLPANDQDDPEYPCVLGDVTTLKDAVNWQPSIDLANGIKDTVSQLRRQEFENRD